MANNTTLPGTGEVIRDQDRSGVKTQVFGVDLNIGGGSEVLQTATALADATANPTVPGYAAFGMGYNGTTWDRLTSTTANGLDVDVTRLPPLVAGTANIGDVDVLTTVDPTPVTGSGSLTAAEQATTLTLTGQANTTFQLTGTWTATVTFEASNDNTNWTTIYSLRAGDNTITQTVTNSANNDIYRCTSAGFGYIRARCSAYTSGTIVVTARAVSNTSGVFINFPLPAGTNTIGGIAGDIAHDIADSGNPVKIGGVAVSGSATPTSVAAADRVRFIANQHGVPYHMAGHPNLITREYDFGTAAQTDVNLAAALVAADERIYVTRFEAMCDNANTVAVSVRAGFGTANVPTASATGVSGMIASHPGIAAGSGFVSGNGSGILAIGAAGEEPRITTSAATSGNLHVVISYYLIDETP